MKGVVYNNQQTEAFIEKQIFNALEDIMVLIWAL